MNITFAQCKQIRDNYGDDWREAIERMRDIPNWIEGPLEIYDIASIQQGGCDSGAYMPAVTYFTAQETMSEYGNEVLDFIVERGWELPRLDEHHSWAGLACSCLSLAVEIWCGQFYVYGVEY